MSRSKLAKYGVTSNDWRTEGKTIYRPCARVVRAALADAGLEHLVSKIGTGRKHCNIDLVWNDDHVARELDAGRVVTALQPLWDDGGSRIVSITGTLISVRVTGYHNHPAVEDDA